jgi:hypothetical protein
LVKDGHPFMLVRARLTGERRQEFAAWFQGVHVRDIRRIPGVTGVRYGRTPGGTWLGLYSFRDAEAVQAALASPEAAYARGTWEQWGDGVEEISLEIFAPLAPLPLYRAPS